MRRGGGVGYDFSRIRPRGARVASTDIGQRAGVLHARLRPVLRDGGIGRRATWRADGRAALRPSRRGGIHPRQGRGDLSNFNISVAVTDSFMQALEADAEVELVHRAEPGRARRSRPPCAARDGLWVYRTLPARELWEQIMRSTYDHAEPGVVFIDRVNADNNLSYCETIASTNPCGEQPLPAYGCCCLGRST